MSITSAVMEVNLFPSTVIKVRLVACKKFVQLYEK